MFILSSMAAVDSVYFIYDHSRQRCVLYLQWRQRDLRAGQPHTTKNRLTMAELQVIDTGEQTIPRRRYNDTVKLLQVSKCWSASPQDCQCPSSLCRQQREDTSGYSNNQTTMYHIMYYIIYHIMPYHTITYIVSHQGFHFQTLCLLLYFTFVCLFDWKVCWFCLFVGRFAQRFCT